MAIFNKPEFNSVWAANGTKINPGSAKVNQGWVVEIPAHENENWISNRQDQMLAHINQSGIPTWDASAEYVANKSYVQGTGTGNIFRALQTNTNVNPEGSTPGFWTLAFEANGNALLKSQNLADVPDKAAARANLGIATTEDYDARYLLKSQNFADVPNKASARSNLGLGNSSILNTGTTANTVATGNDSRIVNAVPNTRRIDTGGGLVGGADLSANRVFSLGTPSHVTATSGNTVSGTTHTHALDITGAFQFDGGLQGSFRMPNGMWMIWGETDNVQEGTHTRNFHRAFPNFCIHVQLTPRCYTWNNANEYVVAFREANRIGFTFHTGYTTQFNTGSVMYFAIGY